VSRELLSSVVGVPLALTTLTLLFLVEMVRVSGRARPFGLRSVTVLAVAVLLTFIAARFVTYS
jgi:hypothetical protein